MAITIERACALDERVPRFHPVFPTCTCTVFDFFCLLIMGRITRAKKMRKTQKPLEFWMAVRGSLDEILKVGLVEKINFTGIPDKGCRWMIFTQSCKFRLLVGSSFQLFSWMFWWGGY
uniref:Uncharacterized protein n=1 Tax=Cucumis melo TaxID=3656 RepID=A0A9I9E617_CUCME